MRSTPLKAASIRPVAPVSSIKRTTKAETVTRVVVLAFDGISPFHLSVPCMVFGPDMQGEGMPLFQLTVCAERKGRLRSTAGFDLQVSAGLEALAATDIVVIPSWLMTASGAQQASPRLLHAIRQAAERGATMVGLCLGTFLLAQAGLLQGCEATTHWAASAWLQAEHAEVILRPDVLYVESGAVLTSAGTAAAIDCCLHLLRSRYGAAVANQVARRMVVAPHRQGGQAQYVTQSLPQAGAQHRLAGLLTWMQAHLTEAQSLDQLAARVQMSRRTFTRQFLAVTGTTVGQWLLHQRLNLAKQQLEQTDRSMEQIALDSGLGSAVSLRQHFAAQLGVSPTAYRRSFALTQRI